MKRELNVGMKFLMPVEVLQINLDTILVSTPDSSRLGAFSMNKGRLDGLTPEGGWPREPFKHGDSVVPVGSPDCDPRTIWGDERDSIVCVEYRDVFFKRGASEYELAPSE